MTRDFYLDADNLFHKWGFGDGDTFDDWWWEVYDDSPPKNSDDVLEKLVRVYLVPLIEEAGHTIEIIRIGTNHNPIRAEKLDGEQVDWYNSEWEIFKPTISVMVTKEQVEEIIKGMPAVA